MDYGIITHYDVHNHGAVLQLTALIKVLKQRFGLTAQALKFEKNYDFMGVEKRAKYQPSLKSLGIYLKFLQERGFKATLFNYKKKKLLDEFKGARGLIGPYYSDCQPLKGVIVGSDEVFALHTGPTPVFFGYCCPSNNVFSYAGSFGPTTMEDIQNLHCEAFVKGGLNSMNGLAVRDKNSASIAKKLTGKEVPLVVDPVILYGFEKEISSFEQPHQPRYLLVYAYDKNMNDPAEVEAVRQFAAAKNLKILSPGFFHDWADENINVDPVELLRYFKYADCVITDTFHGSVMSVIAQTPFAVKLRGNGNKVLNLLDEYGLSTRAIQKLQLEELEKTFSIEIDWKDVNSRLSDRREQSMAYLSDMISAKP